MAVDAVLAVADLETRDVNFELIKMLTKVFWSIISIYKQNSNGSYNLKNSEFNFLQIGSI